jgi:hypothetical protein
MYFSIQLTKCKINCFIVEKDFLIEKKLTKVVFHLFTIVLSCVPD